MAERLRSSRGDGVGEPAGAGQHEQDHGRRIAIPHSHAHVAVGDSGVCPGTLCATAAGDLLAASGDGDLALVSVVADPMPPHAADARTSQAIVVAFLDTSPAVPENGDLEEHLVVTDGARTWAPDALPGVMAATSADPTWLRLRAAVNVAIAHEK